MTLFAQLSCGADRLVFHCYRVEPGNFSSIPIFHHMAGCTGNSCPVCFLNENVAISHCHFLTGEFTGNAIWRSAYSRFRVPVLGGVAASTPIVRPMALIICAVGATFPSYVIFRLIFRCLGRLGRYCCGFNNNGNLYLFNLNFCWRRLTATYYQQQQDKSSYE